MNCPQCKRPTFLTQVRHPDTKECYACGYVESDVCPGRRKPHDAEERFFYCERCCP